MSAAKTHTPRQDSTGLILDETPGGILVFKNVTHGRELIGFAEVTNRSKLKTALRKRGLGTGAVYNKPVRDMSEWATVRN
jgi:hypothetical protein